MVWRCFRWTLVENYLYVEGLRCRVWGWTERSVVERQPTFTRGMSAISRAKSNKGGRTMQLGFQAANAVRNAASCVNNLTPRLHMQVLCDFAYKTRLGLPRKDISSYNTATKPRQVSINWTEKRCQPIDLIIFFPIHAMVRKKSIRVRGRIRRVFYAKSHQKSHV